MKLLLDANVSWRLCTVLKQHFEDCLHVDNIGLNIPAFKHKQDIEFLYASEDYGILELF